MRNAFVLFVALAALVGASASSFGAGFLILAKPAGGSGPSYAEITTISSTSNTATTTWDVTISPSLAGGTLIVACGYGAGGLATAVFDPTGQNVSLTAQANDGGGNAVLFSAPITAAGAGSTLRLGAGASTNGQRFDCVIWLAQSLTSSTPTSTAGNVGSAFSISAAASQFLFSFGYVGIDRTPDWSPSTQTPDHTYNTGAAGTDSYGHAADWTVASTNASFSMNPNSGAYYFVAAQYH